MAVNKKGQTIIPRCFDRIKVDKLITGDEVLFIGGTWLTEFHGKNRRKEFGRSDTPPYHAAVVYDKDSDGNVLILDQELNGTLGFIAEYLGKKELRIDIVRPTSTVAQRLLVKSKIKKLATQKGLYDCRGFLYFLKQMPYCGWLPMPKPSNKLYYCSDAVAEVWEETGVQVSPRDNNFTAPVDLQCFGLEHFDCFTLKKAGELL